MPPEITTPTADNAGLTIIPALVNESIIRKAFVPVCKRTLARWISSGRFPRAEIVDGGKLRLWKRETIESWIAASIEKGALS